MVSDGPLRSIDNPGMHGRVSSLARESHAGSERYSLAFPQLGAAPRRGDETARINAPLHEPARSQAYRPIDDRRTLSTSAPLH